MPTHRRTRSSSPTRALASKLQFGYGGGVERFPAEPSLSRASSAEAGGATAASASASTSALASSVAAAAAAGGVVAGGKKRISRLRHSSGGESATGGNENTRSQSTAHRKSLPSTFSAASSGLPRRTNTTTPTALPSHTRSASASASISPGLYLSTGAGGPGNAAALLPPPTKQHRATSSGIQRPGFRLLDASLSLSASRSSESDEWAGAADRERDRNRERDRELRYGRNRDQERERSRYKAKHGSNSGIGISISSDGSDSGSGRKKRNSAAAATTTTTTTTDISPRYAGVGESSSSSTIGSAATVAAPSHQRSAHASGMRVPSYQPHQSPEKVRYHQQQQQQQQQQQRSHLSAPPAATLDSAARSSPEREVRQADFASPETGGGGGGRGKKGRRSGIPKPGFRSPDGSGPSGGGAGASVSERDYGPAKHPSAVAAAAAAAASSSSAPSTDEIRRTRNGSGASAAATAPAPALVVTARRDSNDGSKSGQHSRAQRTSSKDGEGFSRAREILAAKAERTAAAAAVLAASKSDPTSRSAQNARPSYSSRSADRSASTRPSRSPSRSSSRSPSESQSSPLAAAAAAAPVSPPNFGPEAALSPPLSAIRVPNGGGGGGGGGRGGGGDVDDYYCYDDDGTAAARSTGGTSALTDDSAWTGAPGGGGGGAGAAGARTVGGSPSAGGGGGGHAPPPPTLPEEEDADAASASDVGAGVGWREGATRPISTSSSSSSSSFSPPKSAKGGGRSKSSPQSTKPSDSEARSRPSSSGAAAIDRVSSPSPSPSPPSPSSSMSKSPPPSPRNARGGKTGRSPTSSTNDGGKDGGGSADDGEKADEAVLETLGTGLSFDSEVAAATAAAAAALSATSASGGGGSEDEGTTTGGTGDGGVGSAEAEPGSSSPSPSPSSIDGSARRSSPARPPATSTSTPTPTPAPSGVLPKRPSGTSSSRSSTPTAAAAAAAAAAATTNNSSTSGSGTQRSSILRAVAAAEKVPGASWANVAEAVSAGSFREDEKVALALPSAVQRASSSSAAADDSPVNAMKALMPLLSDPSNRSCADCRSPLIDSSKICCSFYFHDPETLAKKKKLAVAGADGKAGSRMGIKNPDSGGNNPRVLGAKADFRLHHQAFAPPGGGGGAPPKKGGGGVGSNAPPPTSSASAVDPALLASHRAGGHGVFLCPSCSRAHRALGQSGARVKSIQLGSWTQAEIDVVLRSGGNARARAVYEKYMPEHWKQMIPTNASSAEERELFVRAKYETIAFMFPSGPLSERAWGNLLRSAGMGRLNDASMHSDVDGSAAAGSGVLPNRLVDYFCVVGPSKLTRNRRRPTEFPNLSKANTVEDIRFEPTVLDCYPGATARPDIRLPEHVSKFVFPEGCRPRSKHLPPVYFSFVLTLETGNRMYGSAMHIYDDAMEMEGFRALIRECGYDGALPSWLEEDPEADGTSPCSPASDQDSSRRESPQRTAKKPSSSMLHRMAHMPKCLLLLSHYNFSSLFRTVLRQIYRISLCQAPLPLERYVANFVSEVPLPPQGRIEVRYHLTNDLQCSITRPPPNRLPLAGCPFRPLFSCLSTGNIIVVLGCLLEETRVALCCRQYGMLGPVAEALLSLLFPFVWQGMYIPVMPYEMLDILDAPVPFLVGLHSRYLKQVPGKNRPIGVVFVDLDEDIVHLGFDEGSSMGGGELYGRPTPALPDKDAYKLKSKLEDHGGRAYLPSTNGRRGRITYGTGEPMPQNERELYAQVFYPESTSKASAKWSRKAVLDKIDWAFVANEYLDAISGFTTEAGTMTERDIAKSDKWNIKGLKLKKSKNRNRADSSDLDESTHASDGVIHLLDLDDESDGFSATEVRTACLRFFVSVFKNYEKFLPDSLGGEFRKDEFLKDLSLDGQGRAYMGRVLSSQMFERFVEERMSDPDQPEVQFFDESIVAKNNRSKIKTVTKRGKKETPFLSDESAAITETFTPPAPSNWGLPDDDRIYSYVRFPKLDPELYGKVRPPKQWHHISKKQRRGATSAFLRQQQQILSRALTPISPLGATGRGMSLTIPEKDVEWALHILAYKDSKIPPATKPSGEETEKRRTLLKKGNKEVAQNDTQPFSVPVDDIPKAHRLVLAARRKQSILLTQIVKVQGLYRMYIARKHYTMLRRAAITLQRQCRKSPAINEVIVSKYERIVMSTTLIQRIARGYNARMYRKRHLGAALRIQTAVRRATARERYVLLRIGTVKAQSMWRGRKVRFLYRLTLQLVATAQSLARGWVTRRHVNAFRTARAKRYRTQLFGLWRHARTSFSYRSRFWSLIDGSGFLHLALLEDELERLWKILKVDFKALATNKIPEDLIDKYTEGASVSVYKRYQLVQAVLDSSKVEESKKRKRKTEGLKKGERGHQSQEISPVFPAEIGGGNMMRKATVLLRGEKMQIYEKLDTSSDRKALAEVYALFGIVMNEKHKKQRLVEALWDSYYPDKSMKAYFALFPETGDSDGVYFIGAPSKKALKRFGSQNARATKAAKNKTETDPKNVWVQGKIDAIIKANLKEVSAGLLSGMTDEVKRIGRQKQKGPTPFERQRVAIAAGRPDLKWKAIRFYIVRNFVYPDRPRPLPPRRYLTGPNSSPRSNNGPPSSNAGGKSSGGRKPSKSP